MKKIIFLIAITALLISCKSGSGLSKAEEMAQTTAKIESMDYSFLPQTALPMGGRSVSLSYPYSLKVSKDTISSYLPYFGRAYTAPYPSDEGGIKFTSTNFEYDLIGNGNGNWDATIETKDENKKKYRLTLKMSDSGYATLTVLDNDRQSISFYGKIE